jgi:hypothetical protein
MATAKQRFVALALGAVTSLYPIMQPQKANAAEPRIEEPTGAQQAKPPIKIDEHAKLPPDLGAGNYISNDNILSLFALDNPKASKEERDYFRRLTSAYLGSGEFMNMSRHEQNEYVNRIKDFQLFVTDNNVAFSIGSLKRGVDLTALAPANGHGPTHVVINSDNVNGGADAVPDQKMQKEIMHAVDVAKQEAPGRFVMMMRNGDTVETFIVRGGEKPAASPGRPNTLDQ